MWERAPDPVLLNVFGTLRAEDLRSCSLVCRSWRSLCLDNLLWKRIFHRDFDVEPGARRTLAGGDQASAKVDWRKEYERLTDNVPCVEKQTVTRHSDEVVHVAFSHDGRQLVSCSKDRYFGVWNNRFGELVEAFFFDMALYDWSQTWISQFSPDDTKLMVAGAVDWGEGELAIYSTGRGTTEQQYQYLCRVRNDPCDFHGCWFSDNYFLSATMSFSDQPTASIWLCATDVKAGIDWDDPEGVIPLISPTCGLFKFNHNYTMQGAVRFVQVHSRRKYRQSLVPGSAADSGGVEWNDAVPAVHDDFRPAAAAAPHDIEETVAREDLCMVFLCGDKTSVSHQLGFQRITPGGLRHPPPCLRTAEKVIDFHGQIIGLALSRDGESLYANVRAWPEKAVPTTEAPAPSIANRIETHVVDMRTLEKTGQILTGHQGLTTSEGAFYLYLDVSANLVGSGSEDSRGHLWDRRSGALVGRLQHDACVNSVAFDPADEETCVTASDDGKIKVWWSKRKVREDSKPTKTKLTN